MQIFMTMVPWLIRIIYITLLVYDIVYFIHGTGRHRNFVKIHAVLYTIFLGVRIPQFIFIEMLGERVSTWDGLNFCIVAAAAIFCWISLVKRK